MATHRRLVITAAAERDIDKIYAHISTDSPKRGAHQIARILHASDMLREFPDVGRDRSRLDNGLRSIVERPFVVFYYTEDTAILIARIIHQRQDIESELSRLLGRDLD